MAQNIRLTLLNDAVICLLDQRYFCMIKKQCYLILKERFEWNLFQVLLSLLPIIHLILVPLVILRNSLQRCSVKKSVVRNFVKFTGKHCARVSAALAALAESQQPQACNFILKKILLRRYFLMNLAKFLRAPFFQNPSRWLLLYLQKILKFSEAYSEPCQTSKMEIFVKIVNGFQP